MTVIPPNERGWLDLLKKLLSDILDAVGNAASHLFYAIWPHVKNAWTKAKSFVIAHPWCVVALVLGVLLVHPLARGLVAILGFASPGVRAGSVAALIQARIYGGFVPAGSVFAILQSFGAL